MQAQPSSPSTPFQGIDVCLIESLFTYGFACLPDPDEQEVFVVYSVGGSRFGTGHIAYSHLESLVRGDDWARPGDIADMLEYADIPEVEDFLELPIVQQLSCLSGYFGWVNLIGQEYYPIVAEQARSIVGISDEDDDEMSEEYF